MSMTIADWGSRIAASRLRISALLLGMLGLLLGMLLGMMLGLLLGKNRLRFSRTIFGRSNHND